MINLTYNGKEINQRESDGYVNAPQMCQANGNQAGDWLKTQDADRYINAISTVTNIQYGDVGYFIQWMDYIYQLEKLPAYLDSKYGQLVKQ